MWDPDSRWPALLSGLHSMVGNRALQPLHAGRRSAERRRGRAIVASAPTSRRRASSASPKSPGLAAGDAGSSSLWTGSAREAVYRATNSWGSHLPASPGRLLGQRHDGGKVLRTDEPDPGNPVLAEQTAFAVQGAQYDEFVVRESVLTAEQRL